MRGDLLQFIARRTAIGLGTLVVSSFVVFAALYVAPGSPTDFLLGNRPTSPQLVSQVRAQYGLDDPFLVRYADWVAGVVQGDFGDSALQKRPVSDLILDRLPLTLQLAALTLLVVLVVGVPAGALAAYRKGVVDDTIVSLTSVASATPAFVSAVVLVTVFAVNLGWFPVFGTGGGLIDRLQHLLLPMLALSGVWLALVTQATRSAVAAELGREHVETAMSRGLSPAHTFRHHVMRNATGPILAAAGLAFIGLFTSSALVEVAFQLNGLGGLLVSSVTSRDFPVVQAVSLLFVAVFIVVNTGVEIAQRLLDPRATDTRKA